MESETISKNGASSKSRMSRGNPKFLPAIMYKFFTMFVFAVVLINCVGGASSTPSSVCDKFFRAALKKDYQTAAKYIYDTNYTDKEKAERIEKQFSGEIILLKYEIQDEQISADGKTANVTCKMTMKMGDDVREQTGKIPAIKTESEGWKLKNF